MNEPKPIEAETRGGSCAPAPGSAADEDVELVAFEWFAMAHPHEAYETYPERFWLFFQTKCPGKTRAEMEKFLAETAEPPNDPSSPTAAGGHGGAEGNHKESKTIERERRGGCSRAAPGSASPSQHEGDWEHDDGQDHSCHFCGGEGWVMGDDLDDPLWYDRDAAYKCPCCHGSGDAKDCTFW